MQLVQAYLLSLSQILHAWLLDSMCRWVMAILITLFIMVKIIYIFSLWLGSFIGAQKMDSTFSFITHYTFTMEILGKQLCIKFLLFLMYYCGKQYQILLLTLLLRTIKSVIYYQLSNANSTFCNNFVQICDISTASIDR